MVTEQQVENQAKKKNTCFYYGNSDQITNFGFFHMALIFCLASLSCFSMLQIVSYLYERFSWKIRQEKELINVIL